MEENGHSNETRTSPPDSAATPQITKISEGFAGAMSASRALDLNITGSPAGVGTQAIQVGSTEAPGSGKHDFVAASGAMSARDALNIEVCRDGNALMARPAESSTPDTRSGSSPLCEPARAAANAADNKPSGS
jgi:hypothetical protein